MEVYKAIVAVQSDLAKQGISKDRKNQQQGYAFRGIDDVYEALAPILSKHGLCFLPRILSRHCEERQTKSGSTLFCVNVEAEFDLVSANDGSKHTIKTYGEAMDSADKATNKAMSAAYKYAAFQAFCIPCEGSDADEVTHKDILQTKITQTQTDDLMALLTETKGNIAKFCEYFKILNIADLPVSEYPRAIAMLEQKRGK